MTNPTTQYPPPPTYAPPPDPSRPSVPAGHTAPAVPADGVTDHKPRKEFVPFWKRELGTKRNADGTTSYKYRANVKERAITLKAIADQIDGNLLPVEAVETFARGARPKKRGLTEAMQFSANQMRQGKSMSTAFEQTQIFDETTVKVIRSGEKANRIPESLRHVAEQMTRSYKLRSKVRSALTSPSVTLVLAFAAAVFLMLYVVPTFVGVFDNLGGELPLPTRIVLGVSTTIQWWAPAVAIIFGGLVAVGIYGPRSKYGVQIDTIKLRAPAFGKLLLDAALANVYQTLALLLATGTVSTQEALRAAAVTTKNRAVQDVFLRCADEVERSGTLMNRFLDEQEIVPNIDTAFIRAGEAQSKVHNSLESAADFHFTDAEARATRLSDAVTPVAMILVTAIVGIVVMACYLPMFALYPLLAKNG